MTASDRGVSEVVGYVLIFALVTATLAMAFTVGVGGLQDAQRAEQINNVERAFDVLDHNFQDLTKQHAPSRATELRLIDGSLEFGELVTISIEQGMNNTSIAAEPLIYNDGEGSMIVYEAGSIIRVDGNSSIMLSGPSFVATEDKTVLALVRTRPRADSPVLVEESGTILITGDRPSPQTVEFEGEEPINISIESPRAHAWKPFFDEFTGMDGVGNETVISYEEIQPSEIEGETLSIVRIRIRISLSN